ncbi:hypothetical protein E1162_09495 [Rhodobacteraceae bacterium RKSG542]|uniref:hypothetical protein n=1 Tax=Pseudovibrio flavus TaxID=2529854 RepID=UPI0012BBC5E6|nr:hypothetical protein [Pseudovibrio flavus]MTI17471.1 hypothetical protein [Pseudovibrio flavus]
MLQALFLKEWIKVRKVWFLILALNLAALLYLYLGMRHQFHNEHSEMIWYWSFELRRILYGDVKYLAVLSGGAIAAAQFLPEMVNNRFRLSFHLPVRADIQVWSWVGIGAALGAVIAFIIAIGLFCIVTLWFPFEAGVSAVLTAAPWLLAGWVAYFSVALVMLEPQPVKRVAYALLGCAFLGLLYNERGYQEYDQILPVLIAAAMLFPASVIYPAYRYRHRS